MSRQKDYLLGALIFVPGAVFAASNTFVPSAEPAPAITAVGAIGLSAAIGTGVALKPRTSTYLVAMLWSLFSVMFELTQAHSHRQAGDSSRVVLSLALAGLRGAGLARSIQALRTK